MFGSHWFPETTHVRKQWILQAAGNTQVSLKYCDKHSFHRNSEFLKNTINSNVDFTAKNQVVAFSVKCRPPASVELLGGHARSMTLIPRDQSKHQRPVFSFAGLIQSGAARSFHLMRSLELRMGFIGINPLGCACSINPAGVIKASTANCQFREINPIRCCGLVPSNALAVIENGINRV